MRPPGALAPARRPPSTELKTASFAEKLKPPASRSTAKVVCYGIQRMIIRLRSRKRVSVEKPINLSSGFVSPAEVPWRTREYGRYGSKATISDLQKIRETGPSTFRCPGPQHAS